MISRFGHFIQFLLEIFRWLEKPSILWSSTMDESIKLGYNTLFITVIISTFTGAVCALQTYVNLMGEPLIPDFIIAMVVRDTMFSLIPTLMALIYSGKVGSTIAGELGTMRITEQIDVLEVLGIRSGSFLVFPKMIASFLMFPVLVVVATFLSIYGGYLTVELAGLISGTDYIRGIRADFNPYTVNIIMVKAFFFSLLVPVVSCYFGFYVKGGALEVGQASTDAVKNSCIAILVADYLITQMMAG